MPRVLAQRAAAQYTRRAPLGTLPPICQACGHGLRAGSGQENDRYCSRYWAGPAILRETFVRLYGHPAR
jgi:hypothetical protein